MEKRKMDRENDGFAADVRVSIDSTLFQNMETGGGATI
jgi:hypothetical protein